MGRSSRKKKKGDGKEIFVVVRKRSRPVAKPSVCGPGEEELFHGTTVDSAKKIMEEGFVPDQKYNWNVKSKKGFVYLSKAYAPFYAMNAKSKSKNRAIVKTCTPRDKLYPEDDFLMRALGKPKYTQEELDKVNLEDYKQFYRESLKYMGNASAKPEDVKPVGMKEFDAEGLIWTCDPVIGPDNYAICGDYYKALSEWLYEGKDHNDFPRMDEFLFGDKK